MSRQVWHRCRWSRLVFDRHPTILFPRRNSCTKELILSAWAYPNRSSSSWSNPVPMLVVDVLVECNISYCYSNPRDCTKECPWNNLFPLHVRHWQERSESLDSTIRVRYSFHPRSDRPTMVRRSCWTTTRRVDWTRQGLGQSNERSVLTSIEWRYNGQKPHHFHRVNVCRTDRPGRESWCCSTRRSSERDRRSCSSTIVHRGDRQNSRRLCLPVERLWFLESDSSWNKRTWFSVDLVSGHPRGERISNCLQLKEIRTMMLGIARSVLDLEKSTSSLLMKSLKLICLVSFR